MIRETKSLSVNERRRKLPIKGESKYEREIKFSAVNRTLHDRSGHKQRVLSCLAFYVCFHKKEMQRMKDVFSGIIKFSERCFSDDIVEFLHHIVTEVVFHSRQCINTD